jgi:hypothetical protein
MVKKMQNENICLASKTIDIAENVTYLELTNRVCYYDEKNLNDMLLPSDNALEKAQTLVNMPVQGKYRTNSKGLPTFGSHEMTKDENGEIQFNTDSIGTHTEIFIKEDTVDVNGVLKTLPCLFAKYRIWKRNKNVIAAVRRLFSEGKLFSSWEIATSAYEFKDGIKKITDYVFLGNCLLGYEYAFPSYGVDAKAISLASIENELLIAEALSQDLLAESLNKNTTEGGSQEIMEKENTTNVAEENITTNENTLTEDNITSSVDENATDNTNVAQLTEWDVRKKIREACRTKLGKWCYIFMHIPTNSEVWVEVDERESELDYVKFTYTIENDVVTVSEPENVKLAVNVAEINTKIAELEEQIATKDDALIKAGTEISNLTTQIGELTPFKEKFELAEQQRITAEQTEKKNTLIATVVKSGFITKEEIETSEELKAYVDSFDAKSLKAIVAERLIASLNNKQEQVVDTASTEEKEVASTNLNNVEDELDTKSIMKNYLGGR